MTRIFLLLLVKHLLWLSIFGNVHLALTTTTTTLFAVAAETSGKQQDGSTSTDADAETQTNKRTGTIIGIDLGTTYSCVGVFQKGRVEIISNDQGNRITPSYVSFSTDGSERLVGDAAKNQATLNPTNTIFDIKRLMGRQFNDPSVQADRKLVPYEIVSAGPQDGNKPLVIATITSADGSTTTKTKFSPEEISAMILQKLKQTAEKYLGKSIDRAVVTVPAYFNDAQRRATKDAGMIAGLHVERIINEPTAAAIAYGMDHTNKDSDEGELNVLVFDLGGGTFDVTILTIDEGVFEVLSTSGDTHLGGEDFDQRVMQYYVKQILKQHKIDISSNSRSMQKLRKEVERAKRALSSQYQARLEIEDLIKPGTDFSETLTRAKFEELNADLFAKTMGPVQQALDDAMLEKEDIDEIVLVGGSTRIPKVRQLLKDFFGERELNLSVNPDEAVAYGAAVQGGILSGEASEDETAGGLLLMDVAPLSLGTETVGGVMTVMIKRGTTIPTEKSMEFVTTEDNQRSMTIDVYEGERSMVQDNHLLGLFEMTNLTPLKRGEVNIRVTFAIDANGILQVTAEDRAQKNIKSITVDQSDGRLKQEDIDRMIREANEFAQQDELLRKKVESRNQLESFVWNLHNTLQEQSNVEEDTKDLLDSVEEVMEWLESNHDTADAEDFDVKYSELDTLSRPIMTKIHRRKAEESNNDDEGDDEL